MGAHSHDAVAQAADPEHDAHAAHGAHVIEDVEPDALGGDGAPRTPMWLPFVGGVTMVLAVIGFAATRPPGKTMAELQKEAAAANAELRAKAEAAAPAPAPTIQAPPQMPGGMPNPSMPQPGRAPGRGG